MPRSTTTYTVFISSPGDLTSDREAIERSVDSVNRTLRDSHSVRFETWDWKKDAIPGAASNCQDVIDKQLPAFDIYLGLMWLRFGTPTHGVGSGTEHEFRSSLDSHRSKGSPSHIFFFFKTSINSLDEIDSDQYSKVTAFKKELGPLGVLHSTYGNTADLERFLTMYLTKVAGSHQDTTQLVKQAPSLPADEKDDSAEWGYLDFVEQGETSIIHSGNLLGKIAELLNEMTSAMGSRTEAINQMKEEKGEVPVRFIRLITNQVAEEMERFVAMASPVLEEMAARFDEGIDYMIKAIGIEDSLGVHYDQEKLTASYLSIATLLSTFATSDASLLSFEEVISGMPKMSLRFNKAQRGVLTFTQRHRQILARLKTLAHNLLGAIAAKTSSGSPGLIAS